MTEAGGIGIEDTEERVDEKFSWSLLLEGGDDSALDTLTPSGSEGGGRGGIILGIGFLGWTDISEEGNDEKFEY
jgi:hypothetical protein